ncbi:hypothetical protein [Helicobacter sp. 23-1045]
MRDLPKASRGNPLDSTNHKNLGKFTESSDISHFKRRARFYKSQKLSHILSLKMVDSAILFFINAILFFVKRIIFGRFGFEFVSACGGDCACVYHAQSRAVLALRDCAWWDFAIL